MVDYFNLQPTIDYIEQNLHGDIDLPTAIAQSHYSESHFYRIFLALTQMTLKEYINSRRLSCAAYELTATKHRIIDIAFDYGFHSQEVFTRAFLRQFHLPPARYRKSNYGVKLCNKIEWKQLLLSLQTQEPLPSIQLKKSFQLAGMERIVKPGSPAIRTLWNDFSTKKEEIPFQVSSSVSLGICEYMPDLTDDDSFFYFAGTEVSTVSSLPAGIIVKQIPTATYAVFSHHGSMAELKSTYQNIYGSWLPASHNQLAELNTIEAYSEDGLRIYLPIQPALPLTY